ncbi:MAG: DNA topoisomerase IB [Solirubrobacteraceae bacterium]
MPRLRRSDCSTPGLRRRRRGRGFEYLDADGARVDDPETLGRINALAIPPAWTDVWICPDPRGHLQATGVDAAGRKQYRYHDAWRARRDRQKFEEMLEFARALPRLRRRVARDLRAVQDGGVTRERVLACAARLLDRGFFRIGSESYAEGNGSYGLATIRKEHVRLNGDDIVFDYPSKSGRRRVQAVADPDVREVVAALKRRRGEADGLLAYREGRRWVEVRSDDINEYLKASARLDTVSAKDFRTWNGTVLAAMALARREGRVSSKTARKRAITAAVREVAVFLGNTPAVARSSYIDPRVFDRFLSGWTIAPAHNRGRTAIEKAVLDLISG